MLTFWQLLNNSFFKINESSHVTNLYSLLVLLFQLIIKMSKKIQEIKAVKKMMKIKDTKTKRAIKIKTCSLNDANTAISMLKIKVIKAKMCKQLTSIMLFCTELTVSQDERHWTAEHEELTDVKLKLI